MISKIKKAVQLNRAVGLSESVEHISKRLKDLTIFEYYKFLFRMSHEFYWVDKIFTPKIPRTYDPLYYEWLFFNYPRKRDLRSMSKKSAKLKYRPKISVITPIFNTDENFLRPAIESVVRQAYPYWELCLVDDGSTLNTTRRVLEEYQSRDRRIKVKFLDKNHGIAVASNFAIKMATGEFIAQLDSDDLFTPDALYEVADALNKLPDADMIYSDEDKVDEYGLLSGPFFKPDWCPDSFLSKMYPNHLCVYRTSLLKKLNGFRQEYEGGQNWELVLRLTEASDKIIHIPKILYHWRMHEHSTALSASCRPHAYDAYRRAVIDALKRRGEDAQVIDVPQIAGYYLIRYPIVKFSRVSVIIAVENSDGKLDRCLESLFVNSRCNNFEVIVVSGSELQKKALDIFYDWQQKEPKRLFKYCVDCSYSLSALCNHGVEKSSGDYLLFLDQNTEVITQDWIEAMVEQAQRQPIGAVGGLLLHEGQTIYHAGVLVGVCGLAANAFEGCAANQPGYAGHVISINNYLAVSMKCLMCRRQVFNEVGSFDLTAKDDHADLDFCLRLIERGYRNIYLPHVKLYYNKSTQRQENHRHQPDVGDEASKQRMKAKWSKYIEHDPCYNPNLTRDATDFSIKQTKRIKIKNPNRYDSRQHDDLKSIYCVLDRYNILDKNFITLSGWALGKNGHRVNEIKIHCDGLYCGKTLPEITREDVLKLYPHFQYSKIGFSFEKRIPRPEKNKATISFELSTSAGISERFCVHLQVLQEGTTKSRMQHARL